MKKKPIIKNQEEYENLIQTKANKIFEDFKVVYDTLEYPQEFKDGFYSELTKRTGVTQSNPKFLGVFDGIREFVSKLQKGEKYYDAVIRFCDNNKKDIDEVIDYLTSVRGEIIALGLIDSYPPIKTNPDAKKIESDGDVHENKNIYTIARQIIAMKFILGELNPPVLDQTNVARFLHLLSRGELIDKIQNRNIYQKLLELSQFNKNSLKDLKFVKSLFEKLKLHSIADKIDKEIKRIENLG